MNLLKTSLLASSLIFAPLASHAQDAKAKTAENVAYHKALGGTAAVSSFNAQLALGRIAQADVSDIEKLKRAAGEAGGIGSGMAASGQMLTECLKYLPKNDQAAMQSLIDLSKFISEEANALVEVLKAKARKGEGLADAEKKFAEARAKAAKVLGQDMGFPAEMVK